MISYLAAVLFLCLPGTVLCSDAQFYDNASNVGFALSTVINGTSADVLFQLSVPQSFGWGAVGSGDRMDGSLMFIIYPSGQDNGLTVSVRTSKGHDTPKAVSDIELIVQSSSIENSVMTASIVCYNCTQWSEHGLLDTSSTQQPWIWAAGPGNAIASDSQDIKIEKHATYGTFFMNMPATQSTSSVIPSISENKNVNVTPLPESFRNLVLIHAICLGGSFVFIFPFGVIALRWFHSFKVHWMLQMITSMLCIVGLIAAIALSVMDPEYSSFNKAHQLIGIAVVLSLPFQAMWGYIHHLNFKKLENRTWISHVHLWMGRAVILFGMLDTALGFELAGSTTGAIGIAVLSLTHLTAMFVISHFGEKRKQSNLGAGISRSSDVALVRIPSN